MPTETLLDALADGFIVVDGGGTVRYVNAAVTQALGRSHDQLLNRNVWDAFPEAVGLPFFLHYHWVLSTGEAAQFEAYYPSLDRWLEARLSPLPDGGVATSIWEVSGRKQLEAHLRESEARFRATFEQAAIGMAHVAIDGRILRVNDRLCALLGRSRDELLACTMQELTHPADVGANLSYMRQVLAGERETYAMEKRYLRPDGSVVWGELTGSLVRDEHGVPLYFIGTVEDITQRKRLEAEVAARAAQLRAVFDAITDGVLVLDRNGAIVDANAAARRDLPSDLEAYNALSLEERMLWYQPRLAGNRQTTLEDGPVARLLRGETLTGDAAVDMIVRLPDGRELEVSVGGAPIRDAQGDMTGVVSVIRDVTERRRLERERVHIVRVVAHELGNPLSVAKLTLSGYRRRQGARAAAEAAPRTTPTTTPTTTATTAAAASDSAQLPDYLDESLARMQRLVGDLNTAVRLDGAGDLGLRRRRFDLAALCRREAQLLQSVTGRVLRLRLPRRRVEVEADRDAVGRVITNLLSNADKYS
ncbi:MAG: PAS domain S-box protein, partial [Ktedonobacterales bacterium]